jgi:hypothetical protein
MTRLLLRDALAIFRAMCIKPFSAWMHLLFFMVLDTQETLYQNKKAGIYSFALTLHSSFSTVLPEILGKNNWGLENNSLFIPCDKNYKEWFCNDDGILNGVKQ